MKSASLQRHEKGFKLQTNTTAANEYLVSYRMSNDTVPKRLANGVLNDYGTEEGV